MPTIVHHLENVANSVPENTALVLGDHQISYGHLSDAIHRLASGLHSLGVQKGDRVAIMLPNLPHFCISYYAVAMMGAINVPINIMSSDEDIAFYLTNSGSKALISWTGFLAQIIPAIQKSPDCSNLILLGDKIPRRCIALTTLMCKSAPLGRYPEPDGEDLAVINYTAGTTGNSLGAELTHSALVANSATCKQMFNITQDERIVGILPLFHPLGQTLVMNSTFSAGASLILVPRFNPTELVETMARTHATFMPAVPAMFRALANLDVSPDPTPALKYGISYGGQNSEEVIAQFEQKYNVRVLEAYGLTEAGPLVATNRISRDRKIGSVGLPLMAVEIQIRNEHGQQMRPNQSGEVWVSSPSLMRGYYNEPEKTQHRMRDRWLFSGDIGYLDEDHYLFIQERKDDIIVKGGFHIFPREVEAVLLTHPAVAEVAVVAVPDHVHSFEVKAFVVASENQTPVVNELMALCREQMPVYKSPKYIELVPSLPKSATGRILKHLLRSGTKKN